MRFYISNKLPDDDDAADWQATHYTAEIDHLVTFWPWLCMLLAMNSKKRWEKDVHRQGRKGYFSI